MSYVRSYKDLIVWQKAMELVVEVYRLTSIFPDSEKFGLIIQMRKAVVSIPSNIAEGYGRKSKKEYQRFYSIAYGSGLELETQLIISKKVKMCVEEEFEISEKLLEEVLKMLNSMLTKMEATNR